MTSDMLGACVVAEMARSHDRQCMCDTALRASVEALLIALDEGWLTVNCPESAFLRNLREALDDARKAHGEE